MQDSSQERGDGEGRESVGPLSPSEQAVLDKGLNFSPSPRAIPIVDIIAAVEPVLGDMKVAINAEITRTKLDWQHT